MSGLTLTAHESVSPSCSLDQPLADLWRDLFEREAIQEAFVRAVRSLADGRTATDLSAALHERDIPAVLHQPIVTVARGHAPFELLAAARGLAWSHLGNHYAGRDEILATASLFAALEDTDTSTTVAFEVGQSFRQRRPEQREQVLELVEEIGSGAYTDVVVWEISRIARKGFLAQRFFDACEDNGVTIHVTNGSVRKVEPDGHGRMVADVISAVAAEERRSLIRRTKAGIDRAKREGKWVGQVPTGFVTVDGYLRPNLSPDYEDGETGFHDIADAIEDIEDGVSYRMAARETPNVTRQTLMRIHKDDDRRSWYLDEEADDDRVDDALDETSA